MTITLKYSDVLLTLLTLFFCAGVIYFIVTLRRLRTLAEDVQKLVAGTGEEAQKLIRRVTEVVPRIERLTDDVVETSQSVRVLAEASTYAVDDLNSVTAKTRALAEKSLEYIGIILEPLQRLAAMFTAFQAGFEVFKSKKRKPED